MKILQRSLLDFSQEEYELNFEKLSEERKNAILRYRSEKDRKRSVLGEMLAREGISDFLGVAENEIRFQRTEAGKPFAVGLDVYFSVSHSKDMVICAISEKCIGADVEKMRPIDLRILSLAGTDEDRAFIYDEGIDEEERNLRFFKLWTAKEAYFKYCGTGIVGLKSINYMDVAPYCKTEIKNGYMITVYEK